MSTVFSVLLAQPQPDINVAQSVYLDHLQSWEESTTGVFIDSATPEKIKTMFIGINAQIVLHNRYFEIMGRTSTKETTLFNDVIHTTALYLAFYNAYMADDKVEDLIKGMERNLFVKVMGYKKWVTNALVRACRPRRTRRTR